MSIFFVFFYFHQKTKLYKYEIKIISLLFSTNKDLIKNTLFKCENNDLKAFLCCDVAGRYCKDNTLIIIIMNVITLFL